MSFLVTCAGIYGGRSLDTKKESFEWFDEAIEFYTEACMKYQNVVLADTKSKTIMCQCKGNCIQMGGIKLNNYNI